MARAEGGGPEPGRRQELTNTVAAGLSVVAVAPPCAEILAKIAAVAAGCRGRPSGGLALAGAALPTRPEAAQGHRPGRNKHRAQRARWQGQWREAQGCRCYLVDDDRLIHLLSWQQIQDHDELLTARRQGKEAGLIPADHLRLWVVAEGTHGIWPGVPPLFPTAEMSLDYSHCAAQVHQVAPAP